MQTVNIHEAKTHLSKLIEKAKIPDDIKTMFKDEIEEMFYGKS